MRFAVKNLPYRKSAQISVRDALFTMAPYRLHRSVREHTERQDMPQSGAAASRFGKSPDDIVRSTCGENLHGFHKDCFWGCKIELSVYGVYGKPAFCTLLYAGFAYQPPIQRQILHAAVKCFTVRTSKDGF